MPSGWRGVAGSGRAARQPVGVLALQGDYRRHEDALRAQGLVARPVRHAEDLEGLGGLVLPGGESTTMLNLLASQGLEEPLRHFLCSADVPVLATCAGLILLASEVLDPVQRSFGALDVTVARNGYGRQIASGTSPLTGDGVPAGTTGIFIRAPRIVRVGPGVEVLARRDSDPVLVRQGRIVGACFHPELAVAHPVTEMFAAAVR